MKLCFEPHTYSHAGTFFLQYANSIDVWSYHNRFQIQTKEGKKLKKKNTNNKNLRALFLDEYNPKAFVFRCFVNFYV